MVSLRRSNDVRMVATAARSPDTAASAAAWATLQTLEVTWLCMFAAALITSRGPIIQPTRQPVIAYVFATPFSTTHVPAICGVWTGMEEKVASPYTTCAQL